MKVVQIDKQTADEFVSKKHYSRKPSIFWLGFGLVEDDMIQGVAVYGQPSPAVQKHAFDGRDFRLYELSRVVVQTKTKNAASLLIGRSLSMLEPKPCAVISYADMAMGHCGIIYQATNWLYTGATVSHDSLYIVDGEATHPMTLRDRGITNPAEWARDNNIEAVKPEKKHRYFYFVGSSKQKEMMRSKLKYQPVTEYPKAEKRTYDDGPNLAVQADSQLSFFG